MLTQCHRVISVEVCRSLLCGFAGRIFTFSQHKPLGFNSFKYSSPHGVEHTIINSRSMLANQFRKSVGMRAAFKRKFPDAVFQSDKKRRAHCVGIYQHFPSLFSGGIIFFFLHVVNSSDSDTFQSSKLARLTHFLPEAIYQSQTCADCSPTGQQSSTTERLCLHSRCVLLCCEPRGGKKAGSKASPAALTVQCAVWKKAVMFLFSQFGRRYGNFISPGPVHLRVGHLATETQLHNRLTVKQIRLIQARLSWWCLTRSVPDSFTLSVRLFLFFFFF